MKQEIIKRPQAFLVILRNSEPKQIEADELPKVIGAFQKREGTIVKQGLINGVDIVDIREDENRIKAYMAEVNKIREQNEHDQEYNGGKYQRRIGEMVPLRDVFEGIDIGKYLSKPTGYAQIEKKKTP